MAMSADRTRGFTGDSQRIQSGDKEVARKNSTVSVIRGRLLANMVETASRAARKIIRNLDEKKGYRAIAPTVLIGSNAILTCTSKEQHLWNRGHSPG